MDTETASHMLSDPGKQQCVIHVKPLQYETLGGNQVPTWMATLKKSSSDNAPAATTKANYQRRAEVSREEEHEHKQR